VPKHLNELGNKKYKLRRFQRKFFRWSNEAEELVEDVKLLVECWDCGALGWDRVLGYYCWQLEGSPNPEHPRCLKKNISKEVGL